MKRELAIEFSRVTEAAALAGYKWLGRGDKNTADGAAVNAMRIMLNLVNIDGTIVIGEGEIDEAPMLYIGEKVGAGGTEVDIAVDPLEGTNLTAKGQDGSIAVMAIGGAPEGVLAAAALKCLGGDMQARLIPYTDEERKRCWEMGIDDINRVMTLDDLVKGDDCIFSATAITDTPMMRGVQYFGGGARTMSVVMRYKSGTIRFIDTFHRFDKKAKWSIHL